MPPVKTTRAPAPKPPAAPAPPAALETPGPTPSPPPTTPVAPAASPAASEDPKDVVRQITVSVPIAPCQQGKYVARRLDTDLTNSESITCRQIQDAIEAQGTRCPGPGAVLKFLLGKIGEAAKPGDPVNPATR